MPCNESGRRARAGRAAPRRSRTAARALVLAACVTAATLQMALGQDWSPRLVRPESDLRLPGDPIDILLPPEVGMETVRYLALELDGFDVSRMVRLARVEQGVVVSVQLATPLAAGEHDLRLVQYTPEGEILERGAWSLEVRHSRALRELTVGTRATLDVSSRFQESGLPQAPESTQGQGSAAFETHAADAGWEVEGVMDLLFDSQGVELQTGSAEALEDPRTGDSLDMGEFYVQGRTRNVSALLGHHEIDQRNLIMRDFYRRGASITGETEGGMMSASGFALRPDPITGFREGLGIGESRDRVAGGVVSVRPLPGQADALALSTMYLSGEGLDESGVGVLGDELRTDGAAWSMAAESLLAARRVRLRAEYAETRYDFDGAGGSARDEDDAMAVLAEYWPLGVPQPGTAGTEWRLGAEYQEVGLFFRSIANPSLPFDRELRRVFTNVRRGGLGLEVSLGREEDDVDDLALLTRLRNDLASLALDYTPEGALDEQGRPVRWWLGQPSLTVSSQHSRRETVEAVASELDTPVDQRRDYTRVGAVFRHETFAWSVGHGRGTEGDFTGAFSDRRTELTDAAMTWQPAQRFYVGLQGQYGTVSDVDLGQTRRSVLAGLNTELVLVPDRLTTRLDLNLNRETGTDDTFDMETRTYSLGVTWRARQPSAGRPGLDLWLRGEYQDIESASGLDSGDNPYQLFVGATLVWPVSYPAATWGMQ